MAIAGGHCAIVREVSLLWMNRDSTRKYGWIDSGLLYPNRKSSNKENAENIIFLAKEYEKWDILCFIFDFWEKDMAESLGDCLSLETWGRLKKFVYRELSKAVGEEKVALRKVKEILERVEV